MRHDRMQLPTWSRRASAARWARRTSPIVLLLMLGVVAIIARRQAPWIPWTYLGAVIGLAVAAWAVVCYRWGPRSLRWSGFAVVTATLVALCPVPWMTAATDDPPGTAWRLDGRLVVSGERMDPPGRWYWLTVGRPPIVAEVLQSWATGKQAPLNLSSGRAGSQPRINEPAAVAVGLAAAGRPVEFDLVVELSEPGIRGLPERIVVVALNGIAVNSRAAWETALTSLGERNTFVGASGHPLRFAGTELPYARVDLLDVPAQRLDARVGGAFAETPAGNWFRGLSVGRSHGLMVALVTYAHVAGDDLARGRTIAGTGGIRADGSVSRIGGLTAKAAAALDAGADVLLFPADQAEQLVDFDAGRMTLLPIASIDEAIAALRG